MSDCLSVSRYKIMVFVREVDKARLEAPENRLDKCKRFVGTAMFDEHLKGGCLFL
jgi:hypothetical protein